MKQRLLLVLGLLVLPAIFTHGEEKPLKIITIDEKAIVDWTDRLDENEVFYKHLAGFEMDEKNQHLYYLEASIPIIYKIDMASGRLLKTISSRGQGPGQLTRPQSMALRNQKILVYDSAFGGIKIFDLEGKNIKDLRLHTFSPYGFSFFLNNIIDVDNKNEIYLREIDETKNTCISVFDMNGKKLRTIVPLNASKAKDARQWVLNTEFVFRVDKRGDIVILYKVSGFLKKYDGTGKLIWQRNLGDALPVEDRNKKNLDIINTKKKFQVSYNMDFAGFCFTETGDIFVSSTKGGLYCDESGKPLYILKEPSGKGFKVHFIQYKDKLILPNKMFKINLNDMRRK